MLLLGSHPSVAIAWHTRFTMTQLTSPMASQSVPCLADSSSTRVIHTCVYRVRTCSSIRHDVRSSAGTRYEFHYARLCGIMREGLLCNSESLVAREAAGMHCYAIAQQRSGNARGIRFREMSVKLGNIHAYIPAYAMHQSATEINIFVIHAMLECLACLINIIKFGVLLH